MKGGALVFGCRSSWSSTIAQQQTAAAATSIDCSSAFISLEAGCLKEELRLERKAVIFCFQCNIRNFTRSQGQPGILMYHTSNYLAAPPPRRDRKKKKCPVNPNQSVVLPLNLYRSPCVAACLAPESAIPKLVPGDTGYACTNQPYSSD